MADEPITGQDAPPPTTDWRESIEPEYRDALSKFESPNALGKSYVEIQKAMGSRIPIPKDGDDAAWNEVFTKLGRPEHADKYDFTPPEGVQYDGEYVNAIRTAAFNAGLNPKQVAALKQANDLYTTAALKKQQQDIENLNRDRWNKYKEEWGEDGTKVNLELARRTFDALAPKELKELMTADQVAQDPMLVALYAEVGKRLADDTLIKGEGAAITPDYVPAHPQSPQMYQYGDDPESKRARAYFEARGHKYD